MRNDYCRYAKTSKSFPCGIFDRSIRLSSFRSAVLRSGLLSRTFLHFVFASNFTLAFVTFSICQSVFFGDLFLRNFPFLRIKIIKNTKPVKTTIANTMRTIAEVLSAKIISNS